MKLFVVLLCFLPNLVEARGPFRGDRARPVLKKKIPAKILVKGKQR